MDTDTLVRELIDAGQKLAEELPQRGFDVSAAFWIKASENEKWYFYIVSPMVDSKGLAQAYRMLHPLVRGLPQSFWINPLEIRLIGPSNPIAKDVLDIHKGTAGPPVSPIRWSGRRLGDVSIETAYIYPMSVSIP